MAHFPWTHDIHAFVMSMSRSWAQPRKRHVTRLKRMFDYLVNLLEGAIRFRTHGPNYSSIQEQSFDWARSVYGNVKEQITSGIPKALAKSVVTTHYDDANLLHNHIMGRSVTAVLHLINAKNWYLQNFGLTTFNSSSSMCQ